MAHGDGEWSTRARTGVRREDVLLQRELVVTLPQSDQHVRRCPPDRDSPHAYEYWVRCSGPHLFVALSCVFQLDCEQNEHARVEELLCEYLKEGREHLCEVIDVDVEECCEIEEREAEGEANGPCCSGCEDFTDGRARPDSDFEDTEADEREQGGGGYY